MVSPTNNVLSESYARQLDVDQTAAWKRLLDVQAPYRWNLKRLRLGHTLDVGCGVGRNLANLDGVGVDPNETCVAIARRRGLQAFTPDQLSADTESFDSLLFAHVIEHMDVADASSLVSNYLGYLRPGGRVVFITPQELGYASDSTHVRFCGFAELIDLAKGAGLEVTRSYSFPFPRALGRLFKYNEFVVVATKQSAE